MRGSCQPAPSAALPAPSQQPAPPALSRCPQAAPPPPPLPLACSYFLTVKYFLGTLYAFMM
jgi:hypothetical protein